MGRYIKVYLRGVRPSCSIRDQNIGSRADERMLLLHPWGRDLDRTIFMTFTFSQLSLGLLKGQPAEG